MSCTAEQIAEKKRIALERLQRARQQQKTDSAPTTASTTVTTTVNNRNSKNTPAAANSASRFLSTQHSFYGSSASTSGPSRPGEAVANGGGGGKLKTSNTLHSHRTQPYGYGSSNNASSSSGTNNKTTAGSSSPQLAAAFVPTKAATCSMISAERFMVEAAFHPQLLNVLKAMPNRTYDATTKNWTFHINDYQLLRERMQPLQSQVTFHQLPEFVVKLFTSSASAANSTAVSLGLACLNALDVGIRSVLLPFQKLGVCFGIEKQGRCMIADEMGLGKTYQALALADFYKHDWPLLVCTTAATRDSWVQTILKLMPYVAEQHVVCATARLEDQRHTIDEARVLVISYNLMERNSEQLLRRKFPFVILDESHLMKNIKAKSTRAAVELAKQAKRVVLLTGTPALSRPCELFTQLQIIDPRFVSYKEYTTRYCAGKQTNFGWDASGQSHLAELNVLLSRKFMIRRTKEQVLFDLGEKSRETVLLDATLVAANTETAGNMESYASDYVELKGRQREELLLLYYQETAVAKAKAVCAYLKGLVRNGEKFIVFAHHRVMLDTISQCMDDLKVDYMRIDGRTTNDVRTKFVNRFQNDEKCRVAVLSLKSCNAGITLTATQLVIFAELDWNPSTLAQAESRAHRIGQTGQVRCLYLLAAGTADDIIWELLKRKQETLNKAGLFSDDLADGTFKRAPSSCHDIGEMLSGAQTKNAAATTPKAGPAADVSAFFDDDDDVDFAQIVI